MIPAFVLIVSLISLALALVLLALAFRARRARGNLRESIQERADALDRRCEGLERELDTLKTFQHIDDLNDLIRLAERQGRLDGNLARQLESFTHDLRQEKLRGPGAQ